MRTATSAQAGIGGDVDDAFGAVFDQFRRNFASRGEVGAALTVVIGGRPVLDLWGGRRDAAQGLPWKRDTVVPVFSTSKGVTALVMASLVSRGLLDYDATVAGYWPEFADQGKHEITVRQLFAHEAGLAVLDTPVRTSELADLDALAVLLARQKPAWAPGSRHGYHAITLGLYQNELARRVDPQGRTVGTILAEDFAKPLGLRTYIGLPESVEMTRVAQLARLDRITAIKHLPGVPWMLAAALANPRSATAQSLANPRLGSPKRFSRREILTPEVPSSNGVSDARSLAQLYGAAATGAAKLPIDDATLEHLAEPVTGRASTDVLLRRRASFALGFSRPSPSFAFGSPGGRAYGTAGLGGSFAFADADAGVGYAYVTNRLGIHLHDDPRELALREAVYSCL